MNNYKIRPIKKGDSKRLWQIRNHPVSRKYSGNSEIIPYKNHLGWFEKKYFSTQDNHCFILEIQNKKVIGYCRFDFDDENNNYIISIALDPDYHGCGLGHKLLSDSLQTFNPTRDILAEVQKDNKVSVKLFKNNNFKIFKQDDKNYYLKYKI